MASKGYIFYFVVSFFVIRSKYNRLNYAKFILIPYVFSNLSWISWIDGVWCMVPNCSTAKDPITLPNLSAVVQSAVRASPATKPDLKASPAPVGSTAFATRQPWTCRSCVLSRQTTPSFHLVIIILSNTWTNSASPSWSIFWRVRIRIGWEWHCYIWPSQRYLYQLKCYQHLPWIKQYAACASCACFTIASFWFGAMITRSHAPIFFTSCSAACASAPG